jgi:hypothetical protein
MNPEKTNGSGAPEYNRPWPCEIRLLPKAFFLGLGPCDDGSTYDSLLYSSFTHAVMRSINTFFFFIIQIQITNSLDFKLNERIVVGSANIPDS